MDLSINLFIIFGLIMYLLFFTIIILIIVALIKYIKSDPIQKKDKIFYLSLGESLKNARISNNMTQEFVASSIGVSRQAVSKWENGTSDPSTANLLALSKLYQISPEQLLRDISK